MLQVLAPLVFVVVAAAPRPIGVLVLPIEARNGVPKDLAKSVTDLLIAEAGKSGAYDVVGFSEVENTMSQEQLRQVAGCDTVSCAAEIAGALNREELVMGSIALLGDAYLLSLQRVKSSNARVMRRATRTVRKDEENELFTEVAAAARELMRNASAPVTTEKVAETTGPRTPASTSIVPRILRTAALGTGASGLLLLLAGLASGAVATAVLLVDLSAGGWMGGARRRHGVSFPVAVLGDVTGAGGALLMGLALILVVTALAAAGASWAV